MNESVRKKHFDTINQQALVVAVTKQHAWPECQWLWEAGCRNFGENKVQEALPKIDEAPQDCNWHFIGTLQKNKVAKVIEKFSLIHSVDSFDLAEKISSLSVKPTNILLQVNIEHQHGFKPDELLSQFEKIAKLPNLSIHGLMTMAPFTDDITKIKSCFRQARILKESLKLKELSMGMSNDWQIAVDEGATIVRIGSLFFS